MILVIMALIAVKHDDEKGGEQQSLCLHIGKAIYAVVRHDEATKKWYEEVNREVLVVNDQ